MEATINEIVQLYEYTFEKSFEYARLCSSLLKTDDENGRKILIHILDNWRKVHRSTFEIWADLIEAAGFYPYLKKNEGVLSLKNFSGELRNGIHQSKNLAGKFFHEEQLDLLNLICQNQNVIVSAPTSFGKSLLIEEVVASKKHKNIVIIQPTLALLDETRRKLLKYKEHYKLIVRTSQEPSQTCNIFLFTAERVNEYQLFPEIDFLVIDEFYKLSGQRDDERSSSLNNAFYFLLKTFSPKFYLLGPNIDRISDGFAEKYNAVFYKSNYSLVESNQIDLFLDYIGKFGSSGKKKTFKESVLFDLLFSLKSEQNIIYCSSPARVRYLSKQFTLYLENKKADQSSVRYPLSEWIEKNVSVTWSLLNNLKFDIGIHDGALQKHISTAIIDYFNRGLIKYLFCTSTIIEGVNTSAKNIIYYDEDKGPNPVDFFDYSNIKGRAGRMMEHYVGRIYNFNSPPVDKPIVIDIPFFEQNPIKDEVLIHIDVEEVKNTDTEQYKSIEQIHPQEKEIIKKNGVAVVGQKSIFEILRREIVSNYELIHWNSPRYKQLEYILGIAWDNLIVEGETIRPMTKKKLINMTFNYGIHRDVSYLIRDNYSYLRGLEANSDVSDADLNDRSIQEVFQIMKHWFEYKVPKWLSVMNEIQRYICSERGVRPGNYIHYANLIENDFLRENLAILAEYGIPSSAIRKIEKFIPNNIDQDETITFIKNNEIYNSTDLIEYERNKFKENFL